MKLRSLILPALLAVLTAPAVFAKPVELTSPKGVLKMTLSDEGKIAYALSGFGVKDVVSGELGLEFQDQAWPEKCEIESCQKSEIDETWTQVIGIQKEYRDKCNEYTVKLKGDFPKREVGLVVRMYDEGAAIRYTVSPKDDEEYVLTADKTDYLFNKDYECWYAPYGFGSAQEHESLKATLTTIPKGTVSGCPLIVKGESFIMALTETDLRDWAGLYFSNGLMFEGSKLADLGKLTGKDEAKEFSVDVKGRKTVTLYHYVDGDNSYCHADWAELRLTDKDGKKIPVTKEFVMDSKQDWGELGENASVDGNQLKIGKKTFKDGFGSHAKGYITLKLDGKYATLSGFCGVDAEKNGEGSSYFAVYGESKDEAKPYLAAALAPRLDGKGLVLTKGERKSPWRLFLVGENELSLVTNQMILNCASPCELEDTSWIKAGRCTWNWWSDWNRNLCTESIKKEIDFASRHGWEYSTVDDPWYSPHMGRVGNNVMKGQEGKVDLPEIASFAKEKGVKLILWMHWADINRMMEEAFAYYEELGSIGGMKIDFMNRDDQEMVKWYEKTVKLAAKHHLVVNFHGSYKPSGFARTFPNQITSEGVKGNEASKWGHDINPKNLTSYPFTRYIQGPADLTPGGFLNRQPEDFKPTSPTQVIGTRAHELALCFVLPTPLICLCDNPVNYEGQPGLEFLDQLKATWDETLPLQGDMEKFYICARRSGSDWFVGMIGDDLPQTHAVPLTFLEEGKKYTAQIFQDTEDSATDATRIDIVTKKGLDKDSVLPIKTVRNGGYVAILKEEK